MHSVFKAVTGLALCAVLIIGCAPPKEEKKTLDAINNNPSIVEKGGHVKKVAFYEFAEDPKAPATHFEGEILDKNDEVMGKVEGVRIEGIGTSVHRIEWNDGTVQDFQKQDEAKRHKQFMKFRKRAMDGKLGTMPPPGSEDLEDEPEEAPPSE